MSLITNDNIQNRSPKDLNDKTGKYQSGAWRAYNDITEALNDPKLIPSYRSVGLTIYILKDGILTEYWWRDGIADGDLIEKLPNIYNVKTSEIYSSLTDTGTINSIVAPEIIGCDMSFFIAHRGSGTVLAGKTTVPTDETVQVNNLTGEVTFKYDFDDFEEKVWFDYKLPSISIIGGDDFPYTFPMTF